MKWLHKLIVFLLLSLFLLAQGCYSLNQVGAPTDTAIEITNSKNVSTIYHFERTKTIHHFVYGLVSPDDAGIEKVISDAVKQKGGTRAVNVKMKYQQTFVNGLVNVLTFGIYNPFTLKIEGDVSK